MSHLALGGILNFLLVFSTFPIPQPHTHTPGSMMTNTFICRNESSDVLAALTFSNHELSAVGRKLGRPNFGALRPSDVLNSRV